MCVCVCVCVRSNLPPHTLESQKRGTNGFIAIRKRLKKGDLAKMLHSKVMVSYAYYNSPWPGCSVLELAFSTAEISKVV